VKQLIALKELTTNFAIVNQEKGGEDDDMDFYAGDSYDTTATTHRKETIEEDRGYNNMDLIMDDDDDDGCYEKDEKARSSITTETKPKSSTGIPLLPSTFSFLDLKEKDREDIEDGGNEDDDIEIDFNAI
jgi:hypothetical protein